MRKAILLSVLALPVLLSFHYFNGTNLFTRSKKEKQAPAIQTNFCDSVFHTGDIIFRDGRGAISTVFRRLSLKDPRFSHAGIIHRENGTVYVFHVIGGETNTDGKIRKEALGSFISPLQANSFATYRFDLDPGKIDSVAGEFFKRKIEFDNDFDLKTVSKMYCTEFVSRVLSKVSGRDNFIPLTSLSGIDYVACDNLFLSSHARMIYSLNYQP